MLKPFNDDNRGFTLTELVITIGIIATLAGLGTVGISKVRGVNQQTKCVNNLRGISHALQLYYNDYRIFPEDGYPDDSTDTLPLSTELAGYISEKKTFVCPEDDDPFTTNNYASYDPYYVARKSQNQGEELVLACPRHKNAKSATNLFSIGSTEISNIDTVLANGQEIPPDGTTTERTISNINDEMVFADGSRAKITNTQAGYGVFLVQSVRLFDGTLYSVIRVEDEGTVDVQVTPGSKFEVVTPSVIIGVRGTHFDVVTTNQGNTTDVSLTSGTVIVNDRSTGKITTLTDGGVTDTTVDQPMHSHWHWHADGTQHSHEHFTSNWSHHGNPEAGKKAAGNGASIDSDGDGYSAAAGDCDDSDASINPSATDVPENGIDEDCDGQDAQIDPNDVDDDGDGYSENQGDCDDSKITVSPASQEICDGKDNDCDGSVDEGVTLNYYRDLDGDGYGDPYSDSITACEPPSQAYVTDNSDCDDNDPNRNPGATEIPNNNIDEDCNGLDGSDPECGNGIVETGEECDDGNLTNGDGCNSSCQDEGDIDDDGDGYTENQGDCNDSNVSIHPGAFEVFDAADNDCDSAIDEGLIDADGDGHAINILPIDSDDYAYTLGTDCNDADATINPGAAEVFDGIDNNCNVTIDEGFTDTDGDGYALEVDDCNDAVAAINPGIAEVFDGIDNNCNGTIDEGFTDADGDGYVLEINDCDDNDPNINPGMTEVLNNGIDDDCNVATPETPVLEFLGTEDYVAGGNNYVRYKLSITNRSIFPEDLFFLNSDLPPCGSNYNSSRTWVKIYNTEDGSYIYGYCAFTSPEQLSQIPFAVIQGGTPPAEVYVELQDRLESIIYTSNSVSIPDDDLDGDGFGKTTDCDDNDPNVNPGASETCDGKDNDCDGLVDEGLKTWYYYIDSDGDGYGDPYSGYIIACSPPSPDYVTNSLDLDDSDQYIGAPAESQPTDPAD